jgi:hypothetical protein
MTSNWYDSDAQGTQEMDKPKPAPRPAADPTPDATTELVTCPECGTTALVTLNRRQSQDFCRHCDFPLFWTPTEVVMDGVGVSDDSLRRLPGTTGRAMTASIACPHCSEPNPVSAEVCVRCGLSMHVAPPPPPPEPVYVPPAPVVYEPPPQKGTPWWVWLILGLVLAAIITLAILYGTNTIS